LKIQSDKLANNVKLRVNVWMKIKISND